MWRKSSSNPFVKRSVEKIKRKFTTVSRLRNSVKHHPKEIIFVGGDPVIWNLARESMLLKFDGSHCRDLIEPNPTPPLPTVAGEPVDLQVRFTETVPNRTIMVDDKIAAELTSLDTFDDQQQITINAFVLGGAAEIAGMLNKLTLDINQQRLKINTERRDKMIEEYNRAVDTYTKRKLEGEKKEEACTKIFTECLGSTPRTITDSHVAAKQYLRAWTELNNFYGGLGAGANDISGLMDHISNSVYEPPLEEFLKHINSLFSQCEIQGSVQSPHMKKAAIENAIKRSEYRNEYKAILDYSKLQGLTLEQLYAQLHKHEQESQYSKYRAGSKQDEHIEQAIPRDMQRAIMTYMNSNSNSRAHQVIDRRNVLNDNYSDAVYFTNDGRVCFRCGLKGHVQKDCGHKCTICGGMNHSERDCTDPNRQVNRNVNAIAERGNVSRSNGPGFKKPAKLNISDVFLKRQETLRNTNSNRSGNSGVASFILK